MTKTLSILAIGVGVLGFATFARAEDKRAPKPVVCLAYRVVEPGLAVCSDAKKPFLMRRFAEVQAPGQEAGAVKVLVGWR